MLLKFKYCFLSEEELIFVQKAVKDLNCGESYRVEINREVIEIIYENIGFQRYNCGDVYKYSTWYSPMLLNYDDAINKFKELYKRGGAPEEIIFNEG